MTKLSANERALAKLLNEADPGYAQMPWGPNPNLSCGAAVAAFLARRGVLAVSAKTVPDAEWSDSYVRPGNRATLRDWLRRLARGQG